MRNFMDSRNYVGPKIRKRVGAGGGNHHPSPSLIEQKLTNLLTIKMTFDLSKIW